MGTTPPWRGNPPEKTGLVMHSSHEKPIKTPLKGLSRASAPDATGTFQPEYGHLALFTPHSCICYSLLPGISSHALRLSTAHMHSPRARGTPLGTMLSMLPAPAGS